MSAIWESAVEISYPQEMQSQLTLGYCSCLSLALLSPASLPSSLPGISVTQYNQPTRLSPSWLLELIPSSSNWAGPPRTGSRVPGVAREGRLTFHSHPTTLTSGQRRTQRRRWNCWLLWQRLWPDRISPCQGVQRAVSLAMGCACLQCRAKSK